MKKIVLLILFIFILSGCNKNDMYDKTLALLHERLSQGAITLEEFNRKCRELGKKRQK